MKVLHIMPQIGTGGAQHQLFELIRHSDPSLVRHRVFYYSAAREDSMLRSFEAGGVELRRIPRSRARPARFLRDLSRAIRLEQPDIVHCWLVSGNFWGRLAAIRAGARVIVLAWRSPQVWNARGLWLLERFTGRRVHHTANSHACARRVAGSIGAAPDAFKVIHNGIRLESYMREEASRSVFAGRAIPGDVRIAAMVGRLTEAKNYPLLLRTARLCRDEQLPVHFVIAGDGEKAGELKALAGRLQVEDRVHFLGLRTDVPSVLAASDIFCYTSDWEGFPNALLEAMAAGLPVITTDFDGVLELVTSPDKGTVVPPGDAEAILGAIKRYLDDYPAAADIGRRARNHVRERFAMPIMVENTMEFYKQLLYP